MATAIIPVRGGSIGLPRKALSILHNNVTLLEHTIAQCLQVGLRTVVSTDDREYADVAANAGAFVIKRPSISSHTEHAVQPTLHAIEELELAADEPVFMMFTTCPLRLLTDIQQALSFLEGVADPTTSIVGIASVGRVNSLRKMSSMHINPITPEDTLHQSRQEANAAFRVTGSIFLRRATHLLHYRSFHTGHVQYIFINPHRALDIDTYEQLRMARIIFPYREEFA